MKKATIMMSMLLALGLSSACSNDDDFSVLVDNKLALFEDSLQSLPENDYTGYLHYELGHGWYISKSKPIDHVDIYYPLNLPEEFNEDGIKLSFSGRVVEMTDEERESLHFQLLGGHSYYFIYLSGMEIIEDRIIPYRGNPPFTITDMPGMIVEYQDVWYISYVEDNTMVNLYVPTELSEEFKIEGLNVIISGNVYEEIADHPNTPYQKQYKIELTKIEKAE